ncbi:PaaX family transcriptional regulator [Pseudonocardia acaciae]|uniref:PaaX family transcriptional regulator n=1 Tax=Pseudonocardia acaciae TaxID=551276 RepID=UPI00048EC966|nr:PaaX family transcriptional regulator C-terminal domain-containing protein [Pseudonocardia acaciae]
MKARALVFDLFGDYLRYRGGEVRLRGLIALMDCFEVPASTVRVLATRLRAEGWLESRRDGRETSYLLTDATWRLLDQGRSRIFDRVDGPWDGRWHVVLYSVPESERGLRERLRKKLSWHGFGPLAPSVWLSPHDRVERLRADLAELPPIRLDVFRSRSEGRAEDRDVAARAWDLDGLNRDYAALLATYRPRLDRYRAGLPAREALVERMRLVYDYRKFPFRDPDLPAELLPDGWLGGAAHRVFLEAHELLRAPAESCVGGLLGDNGSSKM